MNYVDIVLNSIHQQDWATLNQVASERQLFKMISQKIQECDEFHGMTILHAVVKYHPPLHILDAMIDAHGDALKGQDCVGRTPLHVACGSGVDDMIIRRLVKAYPEACDLQDGDGKLPLHIVCDTECILFEGDQSPRPPPSVDVVRALLSGSVRSVLVEDDDGMSPIEYAIVSDNNIKVVTLLQTASMSLRRKDAKISKATATTSTEKEIKPVVLLPRSVLGYC